MDDTEILPPATLAGTDPDDDDDIPEESLSDGRDWSQNLVVTEINQFQAQALVCAFEIGKRLLWTKRARGHGTFEEWADKHLSISRCARARFCQYAVFFIRHPKLFHQLQGTAVKRVLLLTALPEEDLRALSDGFAISGISVADVANLPYVELKKMLDRRERDLQDVRADNEAKTEKLNDFAGRIADLTAPRRPVGDETRRRDLQTAMEELRVAFLRLHNVVDGLAALRRDDLENEANGEPSRHLSTETAMELVVAVEGAEVLGVHLREKYRHIVGEAVADADYVEALRRAQQLPEHVQPMEATVLPFVSDEVPRGNGGRMPPRPQGPRAATGRKGGK
jgi:hypothetical protein